jgi:O-antigen/teichoic acid export membrane protein
MKIDGLKRRSFVVRYLTLFGGEGFSKVCAFGAFAYLARTLGPRDFGLVELALSITVFFVLGAESGLGSYGARLIERSPEMAPTLIPRVAVLRAMLGAPAYLVILVVSRRFGLPGVGVLAIYGVLVLLTPFFTQWVYQGLRQMQWVAAASAIRYGLFALLVVLLIRRGTDTRLVAVAEIAGALAVVLFNFVIVHHVLGVRLDWRGAVPGAIQLLKQAWFLGASDLAWAAMWYSPSVIIGWFALGELYQVAWVAAAVRIVMALHTFVWLYFFNMIPNLSKEIHEGLAGWRDLLSRSMSTSMWAGCMVALGGTFLAPVIVATTYGANYNAAVLPFQIAIWMIPIAWFSGHFRFSLIASGHQNLEFLACAAGGITTIVSAFFLVRTNGANGATAALVAGGVVNAVLAGYAMFRVIGPIRLAPAAAPISSCLVAGAIGVVLTLAVDNIAGAVGALSFYALRSASQWNLTRLRHAWEGRLSA